MEHHNFIPKINFGWNPPIKTHFAFKSVVQDKYTNCYYQDNVTLYSCLSLRDKFYSVNHSNNPISLSLLKNNIVTLG